MRDCRMRPSGEYKATATRTPSSDGASLTQPLHLERFQKQRVVLKLMFLMIGGTNAALFYLTSYRQAFGDVVTSFLLACFPPKRDQRRRVIGGTMRMSRASRSASLSP